MHQVLTTASQDRNDHSGINTLYPLVFVELLHRAYALVAPLPEFDK